MVSLRRVPPPARNLAGKIATLQKRRGRVRRHPGRTRAYGREPGVAHRPRQPGDGDLSKGRRGLQRAGRGGCQAPVDRRTGSHQPRQRLRTARARRPSRPRRSWAWRRSKRPPIEATLKARTSRRVQPPGIVAFVPKPLGRGAAASQGLFAKEACSAYDAASRTPTAALTARPCLPTGRRSTTRGHRLILYYHRTPPADVVRSGHECTSGQAVAAHRPLGGRSRLHVQPPLAAHRPLGGRSRLGRHGGAAGRQPADDPNDAATRSNTPLARSSTP